MKLTKKLLSMLLVLCMVLSMLPTVALFASAADTWDLVTDASTLKTGDQVVIVAKGYDYALSTTQNGNNRGAATVTKSGNTVTFGSDVQILELKAGKIAGTFAFYTGSGYLYAASSSKNYLRTETTLSNNSSWEITIAASTGVATVTAKGSNTRNLMQYNNGSTIFASYGSAQQSITIYKLNSSSTPVALEYIEVVDAKTEYTVGDAFVAPTVMGYYSDGSTSEWTNCSFSGYNMYAEGKQVVSVSGTDDRGNTGSTTYTITVAPLPVLDSIYVVDPKTDYYVDDPFVEPTVMGYYSDGSTVELKGCMFSGYDMSVAGKQEVSVFYSDDQGNAKTTSYTITVTMRIAYTLTFNEDGATITFSYYPDDIVELPSPDYPTVGDYTFIGWHEGGDITNVASPADLLAVGSEYIMPEADPTIYAVYAKVSNSGGSGSGNYEMLTATQADYSGSYIVAGVKNGTYYAMNPSLSAGTSTGGIGHASSIYDLSSNGLMNSDNSAVLNTIDGQYVLTITAATIAGSTGYTLQDKNGYYIGHTSSTALTKSSSKPTTANYIWTIDPTTNPATLKNAQTGYFLQFNGTNTNVFRTYSALNTNYSLYLYKLVEGSTVTYSDWTIEPSSAGMTEFTLTYDPNTDDDVEGMPENQEHIPADTDYLLDSTMVPIRRGYEFGGWGETPDATSPIDSVRMTKNTKVYAIWIEKMEYTVYFYESDSSVAIEKIYYENEIIDPADVPIPNPVDGYVFKGWYESPYDGNSEPSNYVMFDSYSITVNGYLTYYAVYGQLDEYGNEYWWTTNPIATSPSYYTLFYNPNTDDDVTNMPSDSQNLPEGYYSLDTTVPVREGYEFLGWGATPDAKETITGIQVSGDTTVYAIWMELPSFDVSYYDSDNGSSIDVTNYYMGQYIDAMRIPTPRTVEGYTFVGWCETTYDGSSNPGYYTSGELTGIQVNYDMTFHALYVKWGTDGADDHWTTEPTVTYTLTYIANGGWDTVTNMPADVQNIPEGYYTLDDSTIPVREGYIFGGWSVDGNDGIPVTQVYISADTQVYAIWLSKHYVYYFDSDVAEPFETMEYAAGQIIDAADVPTPRTVEGYTFVGWSQSVWDSEGEPRYTTPADSKVYQNYYFYAVYAKLGESSGEQWTLVDDLSTVTPGTYALITPNYNAFNGTISSSGHGQGTSDAFVFDSNDVATSAPEGTVELTLTASGSGYTMYNETYGYLYASKASSGGLAWHATESSSWSYSGGNWVYASNSARLRTYQTSFRTYGNDTNNALYMAKKTGSFTIEGYTTNPVVVPEYSVNFYSTSKDLIKTVSVKEGGYVSASDIPEISETVENHTFLGWVVQPVTSTTVFPVLAEPTVEAVTGDMNYYAVYVQHTQSYDETFYLQLKDYVNPYIFVAGQEGAEGYLSAVNSITDALIFGLEYNDGNYDLYYRDFAGGKIYVYDNASTTGLEFSEIVLDGYHWILDEAADGTVTLQATNGTGLYLGYDTANNCFNILDETYPHEFRLSAIKDYTSDPVEPGMVTVTWISEGEVFTTTQVKENYTITAPETDPTKADDDANHKYYTFAGWTAREGGEVITDFGIASTATSPVFYAVYTEHSYVPVYWIIEGVTETEYYKAGEVPTHATPSKPSDGTYSYTFSGWEPTPVAADLTKDNTYTATFTQTEIRYVASLVLNPASVRVGKTSTAVGKLSFGDTEVTDYAPVYASSETAVATVDAATGAISALTVGTTDITVTYTVNGNTYTATQTLTVTQGTSGGYTLMTKANTTDNNPDFDWSGDYIFMGRWNGFLADLNNYMVMTPYWIDDSTAVVEDGDSNEVFGGKTTARFNASMVELTIDGDTATGTIADEYSYGCGIEMDSTGLNDYVADDGTEYPVFDRITSIDDRFAFVIELVDDIKGYYTIRIKGTSYYLANTNTKSSGDNGMQYTLDATTDTKALWTISWAETVQVNDGYAPDVLMITSVYGKENNVNRSILLNTGYNNIDSALTENSRFRVYGDGTYSDKLAKGGDIDESTGQTYSLYIFGNPNPFNAQIYYQGDQKTIANPVELPQGMTAAADLESALTPDIADYPNWSLVGDAVWTLSDDSSGVMSLDAATGQLLLNSAEQGDYAIVTVTYTVHDNINNKDYSIATQAKVVVSAPLETYTTIIFETDSGKDTEVQYTVNAGVASLPLDYYVVNDMTGENSKTGTVVEGGTPAWTVSSTNGYPVTITDGVLDLSQVTGKDIIQITLSGVKGNNVNATQATYKVYVITTPKLVADTATITDNTTTVSIDVLANDQNLPEGAVIYGLGKTTADIAASPVTENVTIGTFGSVSVADGKVQYTPSAGVSDGDQVVFYYAVQDTDGTLYYAKVTVTADITNESPDVEPGDVIYNLVTKEIVPDPDSYNFTGDYVFMGRKSGKMVDLNQFQILTPDWSGDSVRIEEEKTAAANNASFVLLGDIADNVATGTIPTAYTSGATASGSYIRMETTGKYDFTDANDTDRTILDRITYINEGFVLTIELVDDVHLYYTIRVKGTNYYLANKNTAASGDNGMGFTNSPSLDDTTMLWKIRWATADDGLQTTDGYTPDQILIESVYALNLEELESDDVGYATLPLSRAILFNNQGWGATNVTEGARFRVYGERAYADKLVSDNYGSGACYNLFLYGAPVPFTAQILQDGEVKTVADPVTVSAGRTADVDLESLLLPDIDTEPNYALVGEPVWTISGNSATANGADIQLTDVNEGTFDIGSATEGAYAYVTVTYTVYDKVNDSTHKVTTDARIVITAEAQSFNGVIYTGSDSAPNTVSKNIVTGTPVELDYYVVDNMTSLTSLDAACGFTVNSEIDPDLVWNAVDTQGNTYAVTYDAETGKWTVDTTGAAAGEIITVTMTGAQAKLDGNLEYSAIANEPGFKIYVVDTLQLVADEASLSDLNALTIDVLANDLNLYEGAQIYGLGLTAADIAANAQTANVAIGTYGTVSVDTSNHVIFTPSASVKEGDVITFYYSVLGEDGSDYYAKVTITVDGLSAEGALTTDTLVIDFGIPVTFSPTANDTNDFANAAVTGLLASADSTDAPVTELTLTEGIATLNADNTVTFKPTKIMTAPAVFYYTVQYKNEVFVGTIQIVPATNVYYEDSMDGVFTFAPSSAWATVGKTADAEQSADFAGDIAAGVYGYDSAYDGFATYSMGSAHVATVDQKTTLATVDFSFYGTGFDVISLVGGESGYLIIAICDYNSPDKVLYRYVVDTYYGYTYSAQGEPLLDANGEQVYEYVEVGDGEGDYILGEAVAAPEGAEVLESLGGMVRYFKYVGDGEGNYVKQPVIVHWVATPNAEDAHTFYQVPVMKINELPANLYKVSIASFYSSFYDHESDYGRDETVDQSYQFIFDAVRVYDPCGNSDIATDAYKQDGENAPHYLNLRDELVKNAPPESVDPSEPSDPSTEDYSGRYYIATKRTEGNYFYMTSDLGTASTERYQAFNTGLTTLPTEITKPENDKVFVLEKNEDGTYVIYAEGVTSDNYLGWTSGNSGTLVSKDNAKNVTVTATEDGLFNISFAATTNEIRYLSLNGTTGNDYFAWYAGTQKQDLALIPVDGGGTEPGCTHENTTVTGAFDATCTEAGYTGDEVCNDCGETVTVGSQISATGHSYVGGTCTNCGAVEPVTPPTQSYEGRYYIATKRTATGNYFYMTSDLGTASTKRYQAVDSSLTTLPETIAETDVIANRVFVLQRNEDGTYSIYTEGVSGNNYLGWTSGNSGTLVSKDNAKNVTVTATEDGLFNISFAATTDEIRYLSLNGNAGSDYFAWYAGTQKQDLALIPVGSSGTTTDTYVGVLDPATLLMNIDDIEEVNATLTYNGVAVEDFTVTYASNDEDVAYADGGEVWATGAGTATVTATFHVGGTAVATAQCHVTVNGQSYIALFTSVDDANEPDPVEGTTIEMPKMGNDIYAVDGTTYTFLGWVTNEVVNSPNEPTTYYTPGEPYTLTKDTEFLALYTYSEAGTGSVSDEWRLVTDASTLKAGAQLVIASNTNGRVAGAISDSVMGSEVATFSSDYSTITTLPATATVLTLGGSSGGWTLANSGGQLLGSTAVKKVAWGSGTTTWNITVSGSAATIQNSNTAYGRILYNVNSPRFTTYTSSTSTAMLLPQLYIKSAGSSGGADGTTYYTTKIDQSVTYTAEILAESTSLAVGGTTDIISTLTASDGSTPAYSSVSWSSSNTAAVSIVSDDESCTATAEAAGTSKITVTYEIAGITKKAEALITVSAAIDDVQPTGYSTTSNSGTRGATCTSLSGTYADGYYTGPYTYASLSTQSSTALLSSLRDLTTNTHTGNTSYDDCKDYANRTDCQNEDGTVTLLYTGYQASTSDWVSDSNGWNREHVWPQSQGGFSTSGPGSDLHHIRPDNTYTNNLRGNLRFGEVEGGTEVLGTSPCSGWLAGWRNTSYFEPVDSVKGDVARICLYMYVRYGGNSSYDCGDLTNVFQSVDVLLQWHQMDPVDTWEMGRNVVVEEIQGNRNPFIDYPELAWLLFNQSVPSGYVTPSSGSADTTCTHSDTNNATVAATCTETGSVTITCNTCGEILSTETLPATGHSTSYTVSGENHIVTCDSCTYSLTEAHTYDETYTCVCGAKSHMTIYFRNDWFWTDVCLYYWPGGPDWTGTPMTKCGNTGSYDVYCMDVPVEITGIVISGIKNDGTGIRDQSPDITSGWYDGICYNMFYEDGKNTYRESPIEEVLPSLGTSAVSGEYLPYDLSNTTPMETRSAAPATRETTSDNENIATGIVFIDGNNKASLEEYEAYGPNNEIYLDKSQAVAFNLSFTTAPKSIQIGLKSVWGDDTTDKASWFVVSCGSNRATFKITTATEMYYDITDIVTIGTTTDGTYASAYPIIITKTNGDLGSLTYLKWTSVADNLITKSSASTFLEEGDIEDILDEVDEIVGNTDPTEDEEPIAPPTEDEEPIAPPTEDEEPITPPTEDEEPIAPPTEDEEPVTPPVEEETPNADRFTDLEEDAWYYEGVLYAVEAGLMNGMSETAFMPDETLTRAMLVTILYRQAGEPAVDDVEAPAFTDVSADAWYYNAVVWAYAEGVTTGITATEFGPDEAVTRQQLVTFLWRAAGEPKAMLGYGESAPADAEEVASYAQTAMVWAVENEIIKGEDGLLKPNDNATRAQIANIFMRYENTLAKLTEM